MFVERFAAQRLGGADEVVDAAAQLALLEGERDRLGAVGLDPRRPEHVVEVDGGERHRLDGIVATLQRRASLRATAFRLACTAFRLNSRDCARAARPAIAGNSSASVNPRAAANRMPALSERMRVEGRMAYYT